MPIFGKMFGSPPLILFLGKSWQWRGYHCFLFFRALGLELFLFMSQEWNICFVRKVFLVFIYALNLRVYSRAWVNKIVLEILNLWKI